MVKVGDRVCIKGVIRGIVTEVLDDGRIKIRLDCDPNRTYGYFSEYIIE